MFNFLLQGKVGEMMAPVQSPEAQLLIAIQNRQQDKIRDLLEVRGVGANFANDRGVRPMHIACQTGDMRLVQRLLELGADTITADKAGNTPLHYASKGGYTEMVKMLVGQGAAVEKRNGSRLTPYDVATDHVVRQYLLPLQLRAEAGNPDYAVHTMGITSDAPRNYEQYGVPGQPNDLHSQPHGAHTTASAGPDRMSTALGALMQAPNFDPPRPGAAGMAPPTAYPGGVGGALPMQRGPNPPPPPGSSGVGFAAPSAALPPPPAMGMGALPPATPTAPGQSVPALGPAPVKFAGPTAAASGAVPPALPSTTAPVSPDPPASAEGGGGTVTPARPGDATSRAQSSSPVVAAANYSPEIAARTFPGTDSQADPQPPPPAGSPRAGAGGDAVSSSVLMEPVSAGLCFPEEATPASTEGVSVAGGARKATPPNSGVSPAVGGQPFSVVPVHVQQEEPDAPVEHVQPGSTSILGGDPVMTNVDLSSTFQGQATISGEEGSFQAGGVGAALPPPPPAHPSSAPSSGRGVPPPSRPQGPYTPGPGPHQPAGELPGKFKPIKPDGFHSSASDKALQRRYGHTKIVRDMGAPPTAAQLGGPPGPPGGGASYPPPMRGPPPMAMAGPPPMVGPPSMAGQSSDGYAPAQARSQYASPQAGYYGQPYGGSGAMQTSFGQQPFAQPPPPAANQQSAMPAYPRPPSNMNGGVGEGRGSLPSPGGYAYTPPGMGSAALPSTASPENESRGGGAGGGYHVFNPSTDRVVAADSTSNAVL